MFALKGLKRLISNGYVFSETENNKNELQQYKEDSDSVLSFIKERCVIDSNAAVGSTELFMAYKGYCEECGMKPFSQKTFVQRILITSPELSHGIDSLGKKRIINGIKLGEILN